MSKLILYNPECSSCIENAVEIKRYNIKFYKLLDFVKSLQKYDYTFISSLSDIGKQARDLLKEIGEME